MHETAPVGRDKGIAVNGEQLVTSRRLNDGDELQVYGSRIVASTAGDRLVFEVKKKPFFVTWSMVESGLRKVFGDVTVS